MRGGVNPLGRPRTDLTGQRFGRLLVLEYASTQRRPNWQATFWRCRCDCGTVKLVTSNHFRKGATRSCGCLRRESSRAHGRAVWPRGPGHPMFKGHSKDGYRRVWVGEGKGGHAESERGEFVDQARGGDPPERFEELDEWNARRVRCP